MFYGGFAQRDDLSEEESDEEDDEPLVIKMLESMLAKKKLVAEHLEN